MEPADHVSEGMPVHRWKPIEDLPQERSRLDRAVAEIAALRRAWAGRKAEFEASGALTEFNARLSRQWCIETGILEGIYTLDRGATTTLVEHGFDAALLSHGDTNVGEQTLIRILRDHQDAIEGLFAFVKQDRPLSTSYVKALHQVLVAHQNDIEIIDASGNLARLTLRKGDWKLMPNNPGDPRTMELVHEYSPPEEVAAEMDRLVALHRTHDAVEAEISAAWLHHRFVQIHPFQDGNGRVARSLATLVLIQRGGFPFVVLRDDKNAYIDALRAADAGDLLPFVEFVCRLQKKAVLAAMEQGSGALLNADNNAAIVADAARRLRQRGRRSASESLTASARRLGARAERRLTEEANLIRDAIAGVRDASVTVVTKSATVAELGLSSSADDVARELGVTVAAAESATIACLRIEHDGSSRLNVLIHRTADSIDVAAAIAFVAVSPTTRDRVSVQACCKEAFTFTSERDPAELGAAFDVWLERALTLGLEIWRRSL